MKYKIKYRRKGAWFWRSKDVVGHRIDLQFNRLDMFLFPSGALLSLGNPGDYDIYLGQEWLAVTKKNVEKDAGQPVNVEPKPKGTE